MLARTCCGLRRRARLKPVGPFARHSWRRRRPTQAVGPACAARASGQGRLFARSAQSSGRWHSGRSQLGLAAYRSTLIAINKRRT